MGRQTIKISTGLCRHNVDELGVDRSVDLMEDLFGTCILVQAVLLRVAGRHLDPTTTLWRAFELRCPAYAYSVEEAIGSTGLIVARARLALSSVIAAICRFWSADVSSTVSYRTTSGK